MKNCSMLSEAMALLSLLVSSATFCHALASTAQADVAETVPVLVVVKQHHSGIMPPTMIGIKTGKTEFGKTLPFFTDTNSGAVADLKTLSTVPGQSCLLSIGADRDVHW